jgi:hypothetical protein
MNPTQYSYDQALGDLSAADSRIAEGRAMRLLGSISMTTLTLIGLTVASPTFNSGAATAAESATVQSFLKQEFAIAGVFTSQVGWAGLFLQKKDQLFVCFVSEAPQSPAVTTRYCKSVK